MADNAFYNVQLFKKNDTTLTTFLPKIAFSNNPICYFFRKYMLCEQLQPKLTNEKDTRVRTIRGFHKEFK